jgi:hypothetical protein
MYITKLTIAQKFCITGLSNGYVSYSVTQLVNAKPRTRTRPPSVLSFLYGPQNSVLLAENESCTHFYFVLFSHIHPPHFTLSWAEKTPNLQI